MGKIIEPSPALVTVDRQNLPAWRLELRTPVTTYSKNGHGQQSRT
jgi:hypothetical protein